MFLLNSCEVWFAEGSSPEPSVLADEQPPQLIQDVDLSSDLANTITLIGNMGCVLPTDCILCYKHQEQACSTSNIQIMLEAIACKQPQCHYRLMASVVNCLAHGCHAEVREPATGCTTHNGSSIDPC